MDLNVERIEAAEEEIDGFITRRARERESANFEAKIWQDSERRYHEKRQLSYQRAWAEHHLRMAASIEETARELADRHRERAEALLEAGGGWSL